MIQLPSCVLSFLFILPFFECIHDKPYSLTSDVVVNASELPGPPSGMEDSSYGLRQAPDHQPGSSGTSLGARFQKHSRSLQLLPLHGHPPAPGKRLRLCFPELL